MRILLLGEYSNVHATLAEGLRQLGHEVTVVSNGDFWKDYPRDIDVSRPKGRLGGVRLMMRILHLLPRLRGFDVVQLINPMFFELRAERLFPIYRYLRRHNGKMVLCAMGMDYYWVHESTYRRTDTHRCTCRARTARLDGYGKGTPEPNDSGRLRRHRGRALRRLRVLRAQLPPKDSLHTSSHRFVE